MLDLEITCFVALPKDGADTSREHLLEAVNAFNDTVRRSGAGFTLEVYSLREGRTVFRAIEPGDVGS